MFDKSKYITKEEQKILKDSIDDQVRILKKELDSKSNFIIKDNSSKVSIMREEGDE